VGAGGCFANPAAPATVLRNPRKHHNRPVEVGDASPGMPERILAEIEMAIFLYEAFNLYEGLKVVW
jgi:hypothetical protein